MKKRQEILTAILATVGLILLILDGKSALNGAIEGTELCTKVLIPTLLPFCFLSNLLSASLIGKRLAFFRPLGRWCRIPEGSEYILLTGFLGGYPLGAQAISQACQDGSLSRNDGRRMLAFCNNCGPAFLFGVCAVLFQNPSIPWLLLIIHVLSAFVVARIIPGHPSPFIPSTDTKVSPMQAFWRSLRAMAGICGWVILFRVLLSFLDRWFLWYFPNEIQITISGFLELSNGCIQLQSMENHPLSMVFCSGFLAFGGLCVAMQTYSSTPQIDHSLYFPGKLAQALLSMTISSLLWYPNYAFLFGIGFAVVAIFLRNQEKRCRNSKKLVV